jgi:hypothetical protein
LPCIDEHQIAANTHLPSPQRIERWRTQGFAGSQVEASVVPGTTDCPAAYEPLN